MEKFTMGFARGASVAPKFDKEGRLLCPQCSGVNLCQKAVCVVSRAYGSDGHLAYMKPDGVLEVSTVNAQYLSGRSNFLEIEFICKDCGNASLPLRLRIENYEDQTFTSWQR